MKKHTPTEKAAHSNNNRHRLGKVSGFGYTVRDGKYYPNPGDCQAMERFLDEGQAIQLLLAAINDFATKRLSVIAEGQRKWWERITEDYGLLVTDGYGYSPYQKCVQKQKPATAASGANK